jgi:hypothetical protein
MPQKILLLLLITAVPLPSLAEEILRPIPVYNCLTREVWSNEKKAWCDRTGILKNASYNLPDFGSFRLINGKYEDRVARKNVVWVDLPGTVVTGKVGPYPNLTTSLLATNTGGSGSRQYLLLNNLTKSGHGVVASTNLGDRVQVKNISLNNGDIQVRLIEQGAGEPMCCGTQEAIRTYRLQRNGLKLMKSQILGQVPLDPYPGSFQELPPPQKQSLIGEDPRRIAQNLFGTAEKPTEGNFQEEIVLIDRIPNRPVVLLTQTGLLDDSLEGRRYRLEFVPQGEQWRLNWVGVQNRCRAGRGSGEWSKENCL